MVGGTDVGVVVGVTGGLPPVPSGVPDDPAGHVGCPGEVVDVVVGAPAPDGRAPGVQPDGVPEPGVPPTSTTAAATWPAPAGVPNAPMSMPCPIEPRVAVPLGLTYRVEDETTTVTVDPENSFSTMSSPVTDVTVPATISWDGGVPVPPDVPDHGACPPDVPVPVQGALPPPQP